MPDDAAARADDPDRTVVPATPPARTVVPPGLADRTVVLPVRPDEAVVPAVPPDRTVVLPVPPARPGGTAGARGSFAYRPALDGVRALAVTAVVLFHAGVAGVAGGFLGVDTFFVLSGFLITSLLLAERRSRGRIDLRRFWLRRARRLLPALLAVVLATVLAGHFRLDGDALALLRADAYAALGYVANWRMIFRGTGYAAATAAPSPLQHTWSLGIEEQFYLLWPLLLAALTLGSAARRARTVLIVLCGAGTLVSQLLCGLLFRPDDLARAYYGTDTRAQALLIGAALAAATAGSGERRRAPGAAGGRNRLLAVGGVGGAAGGRNRLLAVGGVGGAAGGRSRLLAVGGVAGAAGTIGLWHAAADRAGWLYHGGLTAAALATALLLAQVILQPGSLTARLLGLPPLVWLGRISYGVYLWHWPLFSFVTADATGLARGPLLAVRLAATLAVAVVSYVALEQPIRHGALGRRLPRRAPAAVTAGAFALLILAVGPATAGPPPAPATAAPVVIPSLVPRPAPHAVRDPAPIDRPGRPKGAGSEPRVTFFGDSVSWVIGDYLPPHPGIWTSNRAIQGCGIATLPDILQEGTPHTNYPGCPAWPKRWQRGVDADNPDVAVIELNRWELMDRRYHGSYQHVGQPEYDRYLAGRLDEAVRIAGSRGAAVVLLTAAYTHRAEKPDGGLYPEDQPSRVDAWNDLLRAEAAGRPGRITLLDLNPVVCPGGKFTWRVNGLRLRSDGLHYTPAGVQRIIAPWLLPRLAAVAAGTYRAPAAAAPPRAVGGRPD